MVGAVVRPLLIEAPTSATTAEPTSVRGVSAATCTRRRRRVSPGGGGHLIRSESEAAISRLRARSPTRVTYLLASGKRAPSCRHNTSRANNRYQSSTQLSATQQKQQQQSAPSQASASGLRKLAAPRTPVGAARATNTQPPASVTNSRLRQGILYARRHRQQFSPASRASVSPAPTQSTVAALRPVTTATARRRPRPSASNMMSESAAVGASPGAAKTALSSAREARRARNQQQQQQQQKAAPASNLKTQVYVRAKTPVGSTTATIARNAHLAARLANRTNRSAIPRSCGYLGAHRGSCGSSSDGSTSSCYSSGFSELSPPPPPTAMTGAAPDGRAKRRSRSADSSGSHSSRRSSSASSSSASSSCSSSCSAPMRQFDLAGAKLRPRKQVGESRRAAATSARGRAAGNRAAGAAARASVSSGEESPKATARPARGISTDASAQVTTKTIINGTTKADDIDGAKFGLNGEMITAPIEADNINAAIDGDPLEQTDSPPTGDSPRTPNGTCGSPDESTSLGRGDTSSSSVLNQVAKHSEGTPTETDNTDGPAADFNLLIDCDSTSRSDQQRRRQETSDGGGSYNAMISQDNSNTKLTMEQISPISSGSNAENAKSARTRRRCSEIPTGGLDSLDKSVAKRRYSNSSVMGDPAKLSPTSKIPAIKRPPSVAVAVKPEPLAVHQASNIEAPARVRIETKPLERQISIRTEPISDFFHLEARPFARGKFAQVKRCVCRETNECFAAKCIKKRRRLVDIRHEILLEIEALKLSSYTEHIVKLYQVFETQNEMILILEMANGGELQRVIDDEERIDESRAKRMVRQMLEGLVLLHDNEIAHLDLKPQNLLLTKNFPEGDIKLCDFGISRRITKDCEIREICGTPDYVAPEILRYDPISLATDMWSLGVLTYVLLSGYSPFGSENKQQTFCNITQAALDFPEDIFDKISKEAIDFMTKLIVKEPENRLTSRQARDHPWLREKQ